MPADWVIAHVAQQVPHGPRLAIDYVLDGDAELRAVEAALADAENAGDGARQAEALARLEAIDGYSARARAGTLLHGLGFGNGELERPIDEFSGGWRVRLNLARALMSRSDLLLLDEPTNHLDLDAVVWLEQWLRAYAGTLLLISHDRDVLDGVTDATLAIEHRRARLYSGNYSAYEHVRAEHLAAQQAARRKQRREIAHMQRFVDRFRAKASKARQAQSRLKALSRLQQILPAQVDSPFRFRLREVDDLPAPLLRLEDGACGYGDAPILEGIDLSLAPGDRIGLLGPNGAGKSTLIKSLAGDLPLCAGSRLPARNARVGYFAQHQVEQLDPDSSPLEHLVRIDPQAREQDLRTWLGSFDFRDEKVFDPVAPFSGGEKSRLALALLVYRRPNLLLLDEPTNHLDLQMRQALANALQDFPGAVVVVSHDPHLLRLTVDRLLLVADGSVDEFDASLDDYPRGLAERQRVRKPPAQGAGDGRSAADRKIRKRREAQSRQRLAPLRKALQLAEARVESLSDAATTLESRLAEDALYAPDERERLDALLAEQAETARQLADAEAQWVTASEALESAEAEESGAG